MYLPTHPPLPTPNHPTSPLCIRAASAVREREKPKASAPLPPAETKYLVSFAEGSVESTFIMEQKENMKKTLISLLGRLSNLFSWQYTYNVDIPIWMISVNSSSYAVDLQPIVKNLIIFKTDTIIGMLEVEKVILK